MKTTLINTDSEVRGELPLQVDEYKDRVHLDGGRTEALSLVNVRSEIKNLNSAETLSLSPCGFKVGTLYGLEFPNVNDGSLGDFTFTRAGTDDRINQYGVTETMATDVPLIDWSDGFPALILDTGSLCIGAGDNTVINSPEGTLFMKIKADSNTGTNRAISISDGSATNRLYMRYLTSDNNIRFYVDTALGSAPTLPTIGVTDATEYIKVAVSWKLNDFEVWVNGVLEVDVNSGNTFGAGVLNTIRFDRNSAERFDGKCAELKIYSTANIDKETLTQIE